MVGMARPTTGARRRRARNEPGAQASMLVPGYPDPPTTQSKAVFTRALMTNASAGTVTAGQYTFTFNQLLVAEAAQAGAGTAPRFTEGRISRIEVWGRADQNSESVALTLTLSDNRSDGGSWIDYGIAGSTRPHIAVIPNLDFRDHWYASNSGNILFTVTDGRISTTNASDYVVRVSLELR